MLRLHNIDQLVKRLYYLINDQLGSTRRHVNPNDVAYGCEPVLKELLREIVPSDRLLHNHVTCGR